MVGSSRNPYITGRPINELKNLFGREYMFSFIKNNLNKNKQVIVLHGQRRIGKSSVLKQIPNFIADQDFVFVDFDLQDKGKSSLSDILHHFAQEILEQFQLVTDRIQLPPIENLTSNNIDLDVFSHKFLSTVFQTIEGKKIVFLIDEFDIVKENINFFKYLETLLRQHKNLFIIPVVGRYLGDLPNLLELFPTAPCQEIGLLDYLSAKDLITKPAREILTYEQGAIQEIWKLSAGHPYFTQIICFALFVQAREKGNWNVTCLDVENVVTRIFHDDNALGGLAWFWDGLPQTEQLVFSAVAEAHEIINSQAINLPEERLILRLNRYNVESIENLIIALNTLVEKGFLENTPQRRIKVELVRRWLVQSHPVRHYIW